MMKLPGDVITYNKKSIMWRWWQFGFNTDIRPLDEHLYHNLYIYELALISPLGPW